MLKVSKNASKKEKKYIYKAFNNMELRYANNWISQE